MTIKELRAKAREDAMGSKMKLVLPVFFMTAIVYLLEVISQLVQVKIVGIIVGIACLIFSVAASYAVIIRMLKVARKEETSNFFSDVFGEGMKNGWACVWGIFKKIWYWILAILVGYVLVFVGALAGGAWGLGQMFPTGLGENIFANSSFINPTMAGIFILVGFILLIIASIKTTIATYRYFIVTYLKHDYPDRSVSELLDKSDEMMNGNKAKAFLIPFTFIGWLLLAALVIALVSVPFAMKWPSMQTLYGTSLSTMPLWATILLNVIEYFIISFVIAYMQLTLCEFYLERNPLEIYNEGYVKPETNEKKYKGIIGWLIAIVLIIWIAIPILGIGIYTRTNGVVDDASSALGRIMEQMQQSQLEMD